MRSEVKHLLLIALLAAWGGQLSAGGGPPGTPASLKIGFQAQSLEISGVTPSGSVILFAISREFIGPRPTPPRIIRRIETLRDTTGSGVVRLDLGMPVPPIAIWAAVDLATGGLDSAPSPDFHPTLVEVANLVKNDNAGQLKKLEWPSAEMEAILVRPGAGAWRANAAKFSRADENAANELPLRIDIAQMLPVGGATAAPAAFRPGDVLVLVDPRWMRYAVVEVGK